MGWGEGVKKAENKIGANISVYTVLSELNRCELEI